MPASSTVASPWLARFRANQGTPTPTRPCQHSEHACVDGQMVCTTCGEVLGDVPAQQRPQRHRIPESNPVMHQVKQACGVVSATHEQDVASSTTPVFQTTPDACYACGTTPRWRSIYGVLVCGTCHPPASPELVGEWQEDGGG